MNKAIILLSGGLDSIVSLAYLKENFSDIFALTFDYSQKAAVEEIKAAKSICDFYKIKNKVIKLDWLGEISNSSLNKNIPVPVINEKNFEDRNSLTESAKKVWVPNRNALFINIAASFAEAMNFEYIIIGANKEEGETFIDNSLQFIEKMNETLKYCVNTEIKVAAPLINMTKNDIVKEGIKFNIPFNLIYSCYNGESEHCNECESCYRLKNALKYCGRTDIIDALFRKKGL